MEAAFLSGLLLGVMVGVPVGIFLCWALIK